AVPFVSDFITISPCDGFDEYGEAYVCEAISMLTGEPLTSNTITVGPGTLNSKMYDVSSW
ncbi:hypothetical protein KIPB_014248, partial [Kipferlia bialata]